MSVTAYTNDYNASGFDHDRYQKLLNVLSVELPKVLSSLNADAVVVSGTSGLSVAYGIWSFSNDIRFVIVRKRSSHGQKIESLGVPIEIDRYVFLDDFISSGATFKRVREYMKGAKCVGAVLYSGFDTDWGNDKLKLCGGDTKMPKYKFTHENSPY
jgi:adenine/guanine phosphoribosyltransferase-like PRPP-binding protein